MTEGSENSLRQGRNASIAYADALHSGIYYPEKFSSFQGLGEV